MLTKNDTIKPGKNFTLKDILRILPHRDPFLMIESVDDVTDKVEGSKDGRVVTATKTIKDDEFWAKGHFPGNPIMPGVLQIETMAQVGAFGLYDFDDHGPIYTTIFLGCDDVKFRKMIVPGMKIKIQVSVLSYKPARSKFYGIITDEKTGETCCEAILKATSPNVSKIRAEV